MIEEQTTIRSWASMLRISKSQIQTYLICPRKFWFQYVVGAMPEFLPASLPFGRALHAAVATFYRSIKETGTRPELESITRAFEAEWEKEVAGQRLSFKGKTSVDSHLGLGKALLRKFYDEIQPRKVEAIEYPFAVALSDPNTGEPLDVSLVGIVNYRTLRGNSQVSRKCQHRRSPAGYNDWSGSNVQIALGVLNCGAGASTPEDRKEAALTRGALKFRAIGGDNKRISIGLFGFTMSFSLKRSLSKA